MNLPFRCRLIGGFLSGALLLSLSGCVLLGDLVNENLVTSLGIDPAFIDPAQGVVVVAFDNTTRFPATFYAFSSADRLDLTRDSRNFSVAVDANSQGNEVLDCPVGVISPGELDDSFMPSTDLAATINGTITDDEGNTETVDATVAYGGVPLELGESFQCGDLIIVRLSEVVADTDTTYQISISVQRGR